MSNLTFEQLVFLTRHDIPLQVVFDATGMNRDEYQEAMDGEYWFAYGVEPCAKGHSLQTSSGRCIQCDPISISYIKKYYEPGSVYVAWSESLKLCKVGSANDPVKRIWSLNSDGYGGAKDWALKRACEFYGTSVEHIGPGALEAQMHALLKHHAAPRIYMKNCIPTKSRELFDCDPRYVVRLINHIYSSLPLNEGDSPMTIFNDPQRSRMLPTMVALHLVQNALEIVDDEKCTLPRDEQIKIRNLSETVLSAISHGLRYKLAKVPDACIDAYMELNGIIDELEAGS